MTFREMQNAHCAAHTEQEIDCVDCTIAQQNAACELSTAQKAKKFKAPRAKRSATLSARPTGRTINPVAGDVPSRPDYDTRDREALQHEAHAENPSLCGEDCGCQAKPYVASDSPVLRAYEFSGSKGSIGIVINTVKGTALLTAGEHRTETTAEVAHEIVDSLLGQVARKENQMTGGEVNPAPAPTPLQQPLTDGTEPFVAAPAHLSEATVAKGFLLAGNAYFTVRSQKTGTRYTFRVNRAKCSRCGKTDCQCWRHPNYFVSLLTGPDNTADYTYLGMIRENVFRATRATGAQEQGKPFAAFRYVWTALAAGRYPAQVEIWHEGRCGRCGRKLTVPESIERGIGPECATKGGF